MADKEKNGVEVEVLEHVSNGFLVRDRAMGRLFITKAFATYPAGAPVHAGKTIMSSRRLLSILEAAARALRAQPVGAAFTVREA